MATMTRITPTAASRMAAATTATDTDPLGASSRLTQLLTRMEKLLTERYKFVVFKENAINFGILVTYRQTWVPQKYQVGDLVKTIPMTPKEIVRYTTRTVTKKTRAQKELEDRLETRRSEAQDTARVEEEIVNKAMEKTSFNLSAKETFGGEGMSVEATESGSGESRKDSARTKKEFRESVLRSAQEYKQQHRTEVDVMESTEEESTFFHEITNPNDELAVTYLFYELQRQYLISERLHRLTPVILVANAVPAPHEIDDAWLVQHDWILNRAILDDSFRPALDYLAKSFTGAEVNIRILEAHAHAQKTLVENLNQQIQTQIAVLAANQASVGEAVSKMAQTEEEQGLFESVKRIFDPIGLTGGGNQGAIDAAQAMVDYQKETVDRAERERARLLAQLDLAVSALQAAVDKLSAAVKEHYDRVQGIDRLRLHVKDNILYYMQAIWRQEPPDQRYFRLYDLDVPIVTHDENDTVAVSPSPGAGASTARTVFDSLRGHDTSIAVLPVPKYKVEMRKLTEVADLDNVLAYKGNYMVFALKDNNYLTLHMMQDYLDVGDELLIRDPDEPGDFSIDDLRDLATEVYKASPAKFNAMKDDLKKALIERLTSSRKDNELVVVPTSSLYIECLVGTHTLLEDFKLAHRALDVKKVQAEVRHAELENIRLAARALKGKDEDPDIEKKIVVENAGGLVIDTD
jgi:hypothetical protein